MKTLVDRVDAATEDLQKNQDITMGLSGLNLVSGGYLNADSYSIATIASAAITLSLAITADWRRQERQQQRTHDQRHQQGGDE